MVKKTNRFYLFPIDDSRLTGDDKQNLAGHAQANVVTRKVEVRGLRAKQLAQQ